MSKVNGESAIGEPGKYWPVNVTVPPAASVIWPAGMKGSGGVGFTMSVSFIPDQETVADPDGSLQSTVMLWACAELRKNVSPSSIVRSVIGWNCGKLRMGSCMFDSLQNLLCAVLYHESFWIPCWF